MVNIIELQSSYQGYYRKSTQIIAPKVDVYSDGDIKITFDPSLFSNKSREDFKDLLVQFTSLFDDFEEVNNQTHLELKIKNPIPEQSLRTEGVSLMKKHFDYSVYADSSYYLNLNPPDKRIPPAAAYYGIMFLLSSVVRYAPKYLDRFLHEKTTSNFWFVRELCDYAERVFPNLMINLLTGKSYKFSPTFGIV